MSDKHPVFSALTDIDDAILLDAERAWARPPARRRALVPVLAAAACAALLAAGAYAAVRGLPAVKNDAPSVEPPVNHAVPNQQLGAEPAVPDGGGEGAVNNAFPVEFNDVGAAPAGDLEMIALMAEDLHPMSAEESLAYFGLTLPGDGLIPGFALTGGGYGVYRTEERGVYYDVNSYVFTNGGKSVTLTLRTVFKNLIPAPEWVKNGPEKIDFTEINGRELALFRYEDGNGTVCVYTEFALDGVIFAVTACGLENNELALALASVLPQTDPVPDPHTAAGVVTHVDSRTEDYFDGAEHHHSEYHDYITVDCGGTALTVWLPGEAGGFNVGDSVTVTYNGEPATAYNIWPGQLVNVE